MQKPGIPKLIETRKQNMTSKMMNWRGEAQMRKTPI
jgi:hypothetical protein